MTTLDYALMMLDIYLDDDDWQPEAIAHYRQLAADERERLDLMEEDDDSL